MLMEMAVEHINFRIESSDIDEELETLVVLVKMVVEEMRASLFHYGYKSSFQLPIPVAINYCT